MRTIAVSECGDHFVAESEDPPRRCAGTSPEEALFKLLVGYGEADFGIGIVGKDRKDRRPCDHDADLAVLQPLLPFFEVRTAQWVANLAAGLPGLIAFLVSAEPEIRKEFPTSRLVLEGSDRLLYLRVMTALEVDDAMARMRRIEHWWLQSDEDYCMRVCLTLEFATEAEAAR